MKRFLPGVLLVLVTGCGGLATPNDSLFPQPRVNAITFWGHACMYIDVNGSGIVTDPVFEKHTILRYRKIDRPPGASLTNTRVILLSHAHPDHLSGITLKEFPEDAVVLCPPASLKYLDDIPQHVISMAPGELYEFDGGSIEAVLAHHPGGRYSFNAEADGRALGYIIRSRLGTIYYTGDTDLFDGIDEVGLRMQPDIVIMNINGHLHGHDAIFAATASRARVIIPSHYGAFSYMGIGHATEPRDVDDLIRIFGDAVVVLSPGQSYAPREPVP